MPRQARTYLVPEPLEPLNLEEMKFWLRIMQEHAIFIKAGLPPDQVEFTDEAQAFYKEFDSLRLRAERIQNDKKFTELVNDTQVLVKEFYTFKRKLLHMMLECKLAGWNFPLLLDHTAREAEYFMRLLEKNKSNKVIANGGSKADENTFWLRIMADHAKFISHLLDPSETNLIQTASAFAMEFDDLFIQGRDFSSMLNGYAEVAAFKRFVQDSRAATLRLRDFKRAAEEMIVECRLVGIIPALLADHVRREADHFLLILTMIEKGVIKNMQIVEDEEILPVQDVEPKQKIFKMLCTEREKEESPIAKEVKEVKEVKDFKEFKEVDDDLEWMVKEKIYSKSKVNIEPPNINPEPKATVVEKTIPITEKISPEKISYTSDSPASDSKYKWSGKWPRQLGKKDE